MRRIQTTHRLVVLFERGLRLRNPIWGEVRKGGEAPVRVY